MYVCETLARLMPAMPKILTEKARALISLVHREENPLYWKLANSQRRKEKPLMEPTKNLTDMLLFNK